MVINDLNENLQQEFINFLMQKNQNYNKIENSLPSTAEVPEPAQLKNEDNFQIDRIQLREFGEKLDKFSKTMGFFRIIAYITIITSQLV